jgi:hypothetical protein
MSAKRTDGHRKGAIIPAQYSYVFSYNLPTTQDGWPVPSYGINCELDRRIEGKDAEGKPFIRNGEHDADGQCCVIGLLHVAQAKFARHGGGGKCTVCGASFVYGDVWKHEPTGEHIHVGHECAEKYQMLADRSEWELQLGRLREAAAVALVRSRNTEERVAFLAANPGLEVAFVVGQLAEEERVAGTRAASRGLAILLDLERRFFNFRGLSEKQVELALKLGREILCPAPPAEKEKNVAAPTGRVAFRGTILKVEERETAFGTATKATMKITTPEGVWIAWGTLPAAISEAEKGDVVELTGTLEAGREPHFAFFKRPSKASIVAKKDRPAIEPELIVNGEAVC